MLILAVNLTISAGHENEVIDMFRKLQAATRQEPGCITYVVQRSRENPRLYLVYEQYKNEAALEEHRNSPHFKKFATDGVFRFVEERRAEFFDEI
jgi:quinol monooxygenase YgiN